jgi:hypothetical protein
MAKYETQHQIQSLGSNLNMFDSKIQKTTNFWFHIIEHTLNYKVYFNKILIV